MTGGDFQKNLVQESCKYRHHTRRHVTSFYRRDLSENIGQGASNYNDNNKK